MIEVSKCTFTKDLNLAHYSPAIRYILKKQLSDRGRFFKEEFVLQH